ncbi:MAG: glycosyltransferase [Bacteriovoracaceae bacterium]|nr:glycosyltransferase [Bacteriovoracaceae bacterium]
MRVLMFYHSLVSDWNHGNAHFLRGIASELISRGHAVCIYEPENSWSRQNLIEREGQSSIEAFHSSYPFLRSTVYDIDSFDFDTALDGADLVLVHEWNSPELIQKLGDLRSERNDFVLFFHDTHHRLSMTPFEMAGVILRNYDGVLAFGKVISDFYRDRQNIENVWTWHEAADTRIFYPRKSETTGDLVWIGNWGDGERTQELENFLFKPIEYLGLEASIYGVRYPEEAKKRLAEANIFYGGWIANYRAPEIYSQYLFTVHIPRRHYVESLPGIPTIRVFEALACGIPLLSTFWEDEEELFTAGKDFLIAKNEFEVRKWMKALSNEPALRAELSTHGRQTILKRHTCRHRVDELLYIYHSYKSREVRCIPA